MVFLGDHNFYNTPGMLLSVSDKLGHVSHQASGYANVELATPINEHHRFRSGLITRLFTMGIVMRLVDEGVLDVDAPLEMVAHEHTQDSGLLKILTTQYPFLKPITSRQLLNNTSGLPAFDKTNTYNELFLKKPRKIWQLENYLDAISGIDVKYQQGYDPGVKGYFCDSATNYIIAGLVIGAVSGIEVSEAMRELFVEYNLLETAYLPYGVLDKASLAGLMHGYLPVSHPFAAAYEKQPILTYNNSKELSVYDVTNSYTVDGMGNAASISTTSNLIRWFQLLTEAKVVSANYKQVFAGVPAPIAGSRSKDYYCMGFYKSMTKDFGELIWAAGNSLGYSVLLGQLIDKNRTFCLVSNVSRQYVAINSEGMVADALSQVYQMV